MSLVDSGLYLNILSLLDYWVNFYINTNCFKIRQLQSSKGSVEHSMKTANTYIYKKTSILIGSR